MGGSDISAADEIVPPALISASGWSLWRRLEGARGVGFVPQPRPMAAAAAGGVAGAGAGGLSESGAIDYSVHEAWNEATNVYLLVVLASLAMLVYARRNKRKIMRIFTLPPAAEMPTEPNFYDSMKKIRLRQQLEMYSIARKYDQQQPQKQTDTVQLSVE
uniref:Small integral membrane protein 19 n=2 Tax=Crocodylus porosus TaxID=8502 RepID=A0A7M4EGH8_CROPO